MTFLVARIGKPHGLNGEVTVQAHTDDPQGRFAPGAVFATESAPGTGVPKELTVLSAREHRGIWLLGFEGIPDRTGAESLRGTRLLAETEDRAEDDDDGWYEEELVGLRVIDAAGEALGTVVGLEVAAAQDRLVIELSDGTPALVPLVEAIVPTIDVEGGFVVVDAPPGLLDLGRES